MAYNPYRPGVDPIEAAQGALGRALRTRAGLTQKELGARAGADDTYLSQVETGHRDLRWSTSYAPSKRTQFDRR
jgi:DNA-binding XRE family transcriptional regulator